jgi:addiction module RelE/StbE family toxin
MKITYTPRATADLVEIADYLKGRSPQGAARVRAAILETLQNLVQFPRLGRLQTVDTVRKIGVRKYPYLIFYTVDDDADEIVVLTVQHGAREREYSDA